MAATAPPRRCTVDGCLRRSVSHGLCSTHRKRQVRTGDVRPDEPVGPAAFIVPAERRRVVRLDDLPGPYRRLVMALVQAARDESARAADPTS